MAIPAVRQFGGPMDEPVIATPAPVEETPKEKKPKAKADPKLVSAARELRDRWLEGVNAGRFAIEDAGKYDVSRAISSNDTERQWHLSATATRKMLPAA